MSLSVFVIYSTVKSIALGSGSVLPPGNPSLGCCRQGSQGGRAPALYPGLAPGRWWSLSPIRSSSALTKYHGLDESPWAFSSSGETIRLRLSKTQRTWG